MDGLVSVDLGWGITFLIQTGVGVLANSCLLFLYNSTFLTAQILRPTDLIVHQLVLANDLVLLSKGIPQTMAALGVKSFLDTTGCKLIFYLHRVARGVSLSTTCFLSSFQALKLSSGISVRVELRMQSLKCIVLCCFFCWVLQFVLNISIPMFVTGPINSKNVNAENMYLYCSSPVLGRLHFSSTSITYAFSDSLCLGLMAWCSSFMVLVLYRHRRRLQHMRSTSRARRVACEVRATCTILVLMSLFLSFYSLSGILYFQVTQLQNPDHWLRNVAFLVSSGFSTLSPFVFIFSDTRISQFCFAC